MKKIVLLLILGLVLISGCGEIYDSDPVTPVNKEEPSINIIKTDKIEYILGETIEIIIFNPFNTSLMVGVESGCKGNVYIISKYECNKWIRFPEACSLCLAEISTSIPSNGSKKFQWNQRVFTNGEDCSEKAVDPGIYRIEAKIGAPFLARSNIFTIK